MLRKAVQDALGGGLSGSRGVRPREGPGAAPAVPLAQVCAGWGLGRRLVASSRAAASSRLAAHLSAHCSLHLLTRPRLIPSYFEPAAPATAHILPLSLPPHLPFGHIVGG